MATVYGHAGKGAVDKIVDDLYAAQESVGETKKRMSAAKLAVIWFFGGIFGLLLLSLIGEVLGGFVTFVLLIALAGAGVWWSRNKTRKEPATAVTSRSRPELESFIWNEFFQFRNGKPISESQFTSNQRSWAIGGLAEMKTGEYLERGLPDDFEVIHDLGIIRDGSVRANIDHLVLGRSSLVFVDTKEWKQPCRFIPAPSRRALADPEEKMKHWNEWTYGADHVDPSGEWDLSDGGVMISPAHYASKSVGTCLWEASALPTQPAAVVFAVGGAAEASLPSGGQRVTHYRKSRGNVITQVPVPVLFVRQSEIANISASLDHQMATNLGSVASAFRVSAEQVLSADNLVL